MNQIPVGKFFRLLLVSLFFCLTTNGQQSASSETELKKQADKAFLSEKYDEALSPYSQLLSLYPNNPSYNYRYGVSLLNAGKNKANAVNYLEVAAKDVSNPQEVWIYLGQAYMVIGKFDDALGCFNKFEGIVNAAMLKKFNSEELKANCVNAIELLKTRKNIAIVSTKDVARNEFYKYYDWNLANGKLVPAAEQFLSTMDKDNQLNPVMFISNDKQTIYLSSYGKRGERGKDIYVIRKMPNGNWSTPENLGTTINSEANEDFPYLDKDGRTLYFASKSKKSIGGYDIFKSKIDFNTGQWSTPENLGWPINTIGDDYLYVPVLNGAEAFYSTTISSSKTEIELRRIQLPNQGEALVTITGYYAPTDQRVRRDARITILRAGGEGIITSVYTDPNTGKYEVTLEPGQDYVIVVEGGGYLAHAENFTLPSKLENTELKQVVKINREKSNENLVLENYFYPATAVLDVPSETKSASYDTNADSSSMMAIQINNQTVMVTKPGSGKPTQTSEPENPKSNLVTIEKKDEYDPTLEHAASPDEIRQKKEEEGRAQELADDNKKADNYDVTIGNEELASIAILDAKTSRQEADSLNREIIRLTQGAIERDSLSTQMSAKAENASEQDKTSYLNEAYVLKADADNMRRQAEDLKIAAVAKDSEAKASEQEANQLLATINDGKTAKGSTASSSKTNPKDKPKSSSESVVSKTTVSTNKNVTGDSTPAAKDDIKELTAEETPVTSPDNSTAKSTVQSGEIAINEPNKSSYSNNSNVVKDSNTLNSSSEVDAKNANSSVTSSENSVDQNTSQPTEVASTSKTKSDNAGDTKSTNTGKSETKSSANSPLTTEEKSALAIGSVGIGEKENKSEPVTTAENKNLANENSANTNLNEVDSSKSTTQLAENSNENSSQEKSNEINSVQQSEQNAPVSENTVAAKNSEIKNEDSKNSNSDLAANDVSHEKSESETTNANSNADKTTTENSKNSEEQIAVENSNAQNVVVVPGADAKSTENNTSETAVTSSNPQESKIENSKDPAIATTSSSDNNTSDKSVNNDAQNSSPAGSTNSSSSNSDSNSQTISNEVSQDKSQNNSASNSPVNKNATQANSENENTSNIVASEQKSEQDETISSKNEIPPIVTEQNTTNEIAASTSNSESDKNNVNDSPTANESKTEKKSEETNSAINENPVSSNEEPADKIADNTTQSIPDEKSLPVVNDNSQKDNTTAKNNEPTVNAPVENDLTKTVAEQSIENKDQENSKTADNTTVAENSQSDATKKSENVSNDLAANTTTENEVKSEPSNSSTENSSTTETAPTTEQPIAQSNVEMKPAFIVPTEEKKPIPSNINTLKPNPISEEARIAYQAFRSKYKNAKQLSDQAVGLQNRIADTKPSAERDSLINVSNNLVDQSSAMYDGALAQLYAAEAIDPDIEHKMEVNEQIVAYSSSMPTGSTGKESPTLNSDNGDQIVSTSTEKAGDKVEDVKAETSQSNDAVSTEQVNESTVASSNELSPEEAKAVEEATTFTVETPNGKEVVKIDTTGIVTRHPDFPKYIEANKEITAKQVETIDVFADAVNQNKLAVEQKQEQNRLMDKAEVEQDRPTKAQIFIQADAMRDSSKKNEEESAAKFAMAQSKTNEVKSKTEEMQEIRKRIARPGSQLPEHATNSTVKPEGLTQEEVLAMTKPDDVVTSIPSTTYTPEKIEKFAKESFSISNKPIYNKENPIPMNPPIPDGLVFKVQIGAFRNEIPGEKFEGVQPITAETTRPGWVRYCVGLFQTFEPAVVVKKEMQQRGFKDAFVVAYLNGKRIGLDEAYAMIGKGKSSPDKTYIQNSQNEMALLRANNIRPENISSIRNNVIDEDEKTFYGENASTVKKSLAAVEYSVQVGVYRTQSTPKGLQTLSPLFTEKIKTNLYRFTTDHYMSYASADSMKKIARREGVKDAFIVVYRNGVQSALSSVPIADRTIKPSTENASVSSTQNATSTEKPVANVAAKPTAQNLSENKSAQNFPSAITSDGKIIYRVQIGAFKNNIPFTAVVTFLNIADKGITQLTDERGLHIFYAGTSENFSTASTLKNEIVSKGVTDAFVVALQDGKRIVITDEMKK